MERIFSSGGTATEDKLPSHFWKRPEWITRQLFGHRLVSPFHIQFFITPTRATTKESSSGANWLNLKIFMTLIFSQFITTTTALMLRFSFIRELMMMPFQFLGAML